MKLIFNSNRNRFETISTFEERYTSKEAGFSWDSTARVWFSKTSFNAIKLKEFADVSALTEIASREKLRAAKIAASRATDSTIEIPVPEGLSYLPYQKAGIEYATTRNNCLIADEMGLGKTIQALGLINLDPTIRRALIVVPAGLRLNWEKEAGRWLVRQTPVYRMGKKGLPRFEDGLLILGYEEATKYAGALTTQCWDLIVCDEAHYLKNPKAKRTKAILALPSKKWVLLTGTPILNRPIELFPLVQKIDPTGLGANWRNFATRYCGAYQDGWGWKTDGASNLEELNFLLRSGGMIRREKSQVLKDLPEKRHSLIALEPSAAAKKLIKEEKEKALERAKAIRKMKAMERANPEKFAEDIKALKGLIHTIDFTDMSRIRHEMALVKVDQVVDHALGAAQSGPIVVFAHHRDVIEKIETAVRGEKLRCASILGGMDEQVKEAAKEAFQAGELDVLVCSIQAAGVGLTLTRSSHVIFAEFDWTPGRMQQAEDRLHRIGQKDSVLVEWLALDESLDAKMVKTLVKKAQVATKATGVVEAEAEDAATTSTAISEEDFARAKANEVLEAARVAEIKAAKVAKLAKMAELEELKKSVKPGRYLLPIEGVMKPVNLRLSCAARFYYSEDDASGAIKMGEDALNVARIVASLTPDQQEAASLAFGKATGQCCHCGKILTEPLAVHLGIGPDCGVGLHGRYKQMLEAAEEFADLFREAA